MNSLKLIYPIEIHIQLAQVKREDKKVKITFPLN